MRVLIDHSICLFLIFTLDHHHQTICFDFLLNPIVELLNGLFVQLDNTQWLLRQMYRPFQKPSTVVVSIRLVEFLICFRRLTKLRASRCPSFQRRGDQREVPKLFRQGTKISFIAIAGQWSIIFLRPDFYLSQACLYLLRLP